MNQPRRRNGLGRALLRFILMVAVLVAAFFLFRDSALAELLAPDRLSATVDRVRAVWWSPLAFLGLWLLMSPLGLPASPLVAAGAVIFGIWWGTLYNSVGAVLGAVVSFAFARLLGRDLIVHLLGEERVGRVEHRLDQYGFGTLVGMRFLPLPFPLVNFGAALAGVRFTPFFFATLISTVPIIFIYTLFFASLVGATTEQGRTRFTQMIATIAVLGVLVVVRVVVRRRSNSTSATEAPTDSNPT